MWVKCVLVWYSQPPTSIFGLVNSSIKKIRLECCLHPLHSMNKTLGKVLEVTGWRHLSSGWFMNLQIVSFDVFSVYPWVITCTLWIFYCKGWPRKIFMKNEFHFLWATLYFYFFCHRSFVFDRKYLPTNDNIISL